MMNNKDPEGEDNQPKKKLIKTSEMDVPSHSNYSNNVEAISSVHFHILDKLLQKGLDINRTTWGYTCLYNTEMNDNEINNLTNNNKTIDECISLHKTICGCLEGMVKILLKADPEVRAPKTKPPKWEFMSEIVKLLLNTGADPNTKTKNGNTALCQGASNGDVWKTKTEIVKILLEIGVDVNSTNADGKNLLYRAVSVSGNKDIVELLINSGANVNAETKNGKTALHKAISKDKDDTDHKCGWKGNREIIEVLLNNNADVNAITNCDKSVLVMAAEKRNIEMVRLLLNRGADVNAQNLAGNTVLFRSVELGDVNLVKLLVAHGADVNIPKSDNAVLVNAIDCNDSDIFDVLLNNGADLSIADNFGDTALHAAALYGYQELVENLIKRGARVDVKNKDGNTPLHTATTNEYILYSSHHDPVPIDQDYDCEGLYPINRVLNVLNILLTNGADIEAKNSLQETPLFCAVKHKKYHIADVVDFLLDNGANINHKSYSGTIWHCCNHIIRPMDLFLKKHIIQRKMAGFYLHKEHLEEYPFNMFEYQEKCSKEILYLKCEFIYEGISLFDLLSKPTTELIYYLQNGYITKSINLDKFKQKSTQYYNMIYNRIQDAARKTELLECGEMFFNSISASLPILPIVCREHILSYLSYVDILTLGKLFK